jgi:glycosyltransferase involved in cell wall biosynthesis
MLSIGVNAYEANIAKRVGSNLYAWRLLCELEKQTRNTAEISWTIYLPSTPLLDLPKERSNFKYSICAPRRMWTFWRLPLELYLHNRHHNIFLSLGHYAPKFCPYPQAICILDLAFLKFPQFFLKKDLYKLQRWTEDSARRSKHIFTISKSAKKDIIELYKKSDAEITIAYPGVDLAGIPADAEILAKKDEVLSKYHLEEGKYFVALGTIQPRKNIISTIAAFERINAENGNAYKLVLVGKSGWMTEEFDRTLAASSQKENIIVTGFVDDVQKWCILKYATASVLVGFYEGFGIPAVESLSVGVRPVVANTASLPEVVGSFGVLVDPYSVDDIVRGLKEVIQVPVNAMDRAQMMDWVRQFSWEESAKKMLGVLQEKFIIKE